MPRWGWVVLAAVTGALVLLVVLTALLLRPEVRAALADWLVPAVR